jgi:hypothetical protein
VLARIARRGFNTRGDRSGNTVQFKSNAHIPRHLLYRLLQFPGVAGAPEIYS